MNTSQWFGIVVLLIGLEVILWEAPLTGAALGTVAIGGVGRTLVGLLTAAVGVLIIYNSGQQQVP